MPSPLLLALFSGALYAVAGLGYKMANYWQCRTPAFIGVAMGTIALILAVFRDSIVAIVG